MRNPAEKILIVMTAFRKSTAAVTHLEIVTECMGGFNCEDRYEETAVFAKFSWKIYAIKRENRMKVLGEWM